MRRLSFFNSVGAMLCFAVLAACQSNTDVGVTDTPSAHYDHIWVTLQEIWFNEDETAALGDAGWLKFPLATTVTVDLTNLSDSELTNVFADLQVPNGTYRQIRLFLSDPDASLTTSAVVKALTYNSQVNYVDDNDRNIVAPLELVSPAFGIGVRGSFRVSNSINASDRGLKLALVFDTQRDVIRYEYDTKTAFVLNPQLTAVNLFAAARIKGQVDVTGDKARNVLAQAEQRDSSGTSYNTLLAASVQSDGSFSLYPLPASDTDPTMYDVVISGPEIATIVIKDVPLKRDDELRVQPSTIVTTSATAFAVNLSNTQPLDPTGATVRFYQTPAVDGIAREIATRKADPYLGTFAQSQMLSSAGLVVGTYNAGGDIAFSTGTPTEGAATYQVFADATPLFERSSAVLVSNASTSTQLVTVPKLSRAAGSRSASVSGSITQPQQRFDRGYVSITRDGAIVSSYSLDAVLRANSGAGGDFQITGLPGGNENDSFDTALYGLDLRLWNRTDPSGTLRRFSVDTILDLRQGDVENLNLTVQ